MCHGVVNSHLLEMISQGTCRADDPALLERLDRLAIALFVGHGAHGLHGGTRDQDREEQARDLLHGSLPATGVAVVRGHVRNGPAPLQANLD
ncbi:MAG: hypothetical protein P1V36_18415, partial [Planctomycetota bacterium]|nr:hypothetical protein [Planctomycetota bacterium]